MTNARTEMFNKVPVDTASFWVIKILWSGRTLCLTWSPDFAKPGRTQG